MSEYGAPKQNVIQALVLKSLKQVLESRNPPIVETISEDTRLIGPGAVLDSLGLVTFALDLEHRVEDEYGVSVILADDRELTRKNSPFASVQSLAEYVHARLDEKEPSQHA